jgi:ribosomal protein L16 Arg81 hydroxylase
LTARRQVVAVSNNFAVLDRCRSSAATIASVTLQDVVAPLSVDEFVNRYVSREMYLRARAPGQFAPLLPWSALNAALNAMRASGSRLRLVQDGKALPRDAYLVSPDGNDGSPIKAAALERLLAGGATLVLDAVDELFPPVQAIADALEEIIRTRVQVNLYAGWRSQHGFDLHFDNHDTMILQVHGRKHWKLYQPTRLHPLTKGKDLSAAPAPTSSPVWNGVLEDGGLLYMPRGWWHVASPLDEPSLHLTFGLSHPTGAQLLDWFGRELRDRVETRMDVPHLRKLDERRDWIAAMRRHIVSMWDDRVIDRFMSAWDAQAVARPALHLPDTAAASVELTPDTLLRLARGRCLHFTAHGGQRTVRFLVQDRPWTCSASFVPALSRLSHVRGQAVSVLCNAVLPEAAPALKLFLTALAVGGVVAVEPEHAPAVVTSV